MPHAAPRLFAALFAAVACLPLPACGQAAPADRLALAPSDGAAGSAPAAATTLSVMTYNVHGLPWPLVSGGARDLDSIGATLAAWRAEGHAPDVVVLQETFTDRAAAIAAASGYRWFARGGSAGDAPRGGSVPLTRWRGERLGKLFGSGLYLLSDYPITSVLRVGYPRRACAGFDCLAAKGVLLATLRVPGVAQPVTIATTHMNSPPGAARAERWKTDQAHAQQADALAAALAGVPGPLILAGDLNMKRSPARFARFEQAFAAAPVTVAQRWCVAPGSGCALTPGGRAAPEQPAWLAAQDVQAWRDGGGVAVRPVAVEPRFDGASGGRLSDHDAVLVRWRLAPAGTPPTGDGAGRWWRRWWRRGPTVAKWGACPPPT